MSAIASNEPLKLQFTCQNSCSGGMNRKATSIVFTLENEYSEVFGRKIMNFKVCSCPKRDKDKDEEGLKAMPKKRKGEPTAPSTSKKVAIPLVKQESGDMDSEPIMPTEGHPEVIQVKRERFGINVDMPNAEAQLQGLRSLFNIVAGMKECDTGNTATYQPYLTDIQKQIGKFQ